MFNVRFEQIDTGWLAVVVDHYALFAEGRTIEIAFARLATRIKLAGGAVDLARTGMAKAMNVTL